MRLVAAGCFVFVGLLIMVNILGSLDLMERAPSWVVGSGLAIFMLLLIGIAQWSFNARGIDPMSGKSAEEHLRELERSGLLESKDYRAVRAFAVVELEDEGSHYFLELADGSVLFLSGQYLYEYEGIDDDPGANQPRTFPCADFTVRRHKTEGYAIDIQCRGPVLEPEVLAPSFTAADYDGDRTPEDGQLITDRTYDEVKRERLSTDEQRSD
jgi:hypothetical protein